MHLSRLQSILSGLLGLSGLGLLALAIFARALGLTQEINWGRLRYLLASSGATFIVLAGLVLAASPIAAFLFPWAKKILEKMATVWRTLAELPVGKWAERQLDSMGAFPPLRFFAQTGERPAYGLAGGILVLAVGCFIFYQTAGKMTDWPDISTYYDMQAEAFLNGQTALLQEADPRLAQLANPYDYKQREMAGVQYPWDVSYYQGKYYLYWGPVPALCAAVIRLAGIGKVDDQFLVFSFLAGLEVCSILFILTIRKRHFPAVPIGVLAAPILALVFVNPILYVLNRPSVYEAAIISGQFFLVSGILAAYMAASTRRPGRWLVLAGACWALAAGSRINLSLAIAWLVLIFGWQVLRTFPTRRLTLAAALILPLLFGLGSLGWYNFVRFGSPFEPGNHYQLTGEALPSDPGQVVSALYMPPNLYNYLLRPLQTSDSFPYLNAPWVTKESWPAFIPKPAAYYSTEPVSGVLTDAPFTWLAALAVLPMVLPVWPWLKSSWRSRLELTAGSLEYSLAGLLLALLGAAGLGLASLLVFISASMRYKLDFLPCLGLTAVVTVLWGNSRLSSNPMGRRWFGLGVAILCIASVVTGLLLGFSGYTNRIEGLIQVCIMG